MEDLENSYCLGFLFSKELDRVVLIKKDKKNLIGYNGLGGHLKENEDPLEGMIREFSEEAGLKVDNWIEVGAMYGSNDDFYIHVFAAKDEYGTIDKVFSATDEIVDIIYLDQLSNVPTVRNLNYLIPLCLNFYKYDEPSFFNIEY